MSLGLALSGGGIKGAAHIGVIKAFEENNIKIDYISGASSGSIVALLYSVGYSFDEIEKIFKCYAKDITSFDFRTLLKFTRGLITGKTKISGVITGEKIEEVVNLKCKERGIKSISDIQRKIAIPVVDINTGKLIIYNNANIKNMKRDLYYDDSVEHKNIENIGKVIRASSSFPGIFMPCTMNNICTVDGGVRCNTPVKVLKQMGAEKVVAIAFDYPNIEEGNEIDNLYEIVMRSFSILSHQASFSELGYADIVIRPYLPNVKLLEVSQIDRCIEEGYKATNMVISEIKKLSD